jgi:hypothetical protein
MSLTNVNRAQMGDHRLEETDPPDTFLYTLRPYQKQALTWMNGRETGDASVRDQSLHPLWEEYVDHSVDNERADQPDMHSGRKEAPMNRS